MALTIKCYLEADGCKHIREGCLCDRFGCECADVHVDVEKEDENCAQDPEVD